MADEKQKLLASSESQEFTNSENSLKEYDMASAIDLIKEQAKIMEEMRKNLREEQNKNISLSKQLDELKIDVDKIKKKPSINKDEVEKLKNMIEAKDELHASIIDELRFQIQSLRNKLDGKNSIIENGVLSPAKAKLNQEFSSKKNSRRNSEDSNGSTSSVPTLLSRVQTTYRGEIVWRINGFTKKLKKIQSGSYEDPSRSEAFTTGPNSYRLSLWAYLNGRGKGTDKCLSVYVRVMAGEFDPILTWPIKPCYTFYLISQENDVNKRLDLVRIRDLSFKPSGLARPQKDDKSIIVGFDEFVVHEEIEQKNYLLDDSIFIKCVVEIQPS